MRTLHAIMTTSSFPYKYLWAHMQTFFEAYQQFSLAIFKLELSYNNWKYQLTLLSLYSFFR